MLLTVITYALYVQQKGYVVESKRGGGGYIRIMKVNLVDEMDVLNALGILFPKEKELSEHNNH